jgi:hypothetical protein
MKSILPLLLILCSCSFLDVKEAGLKSDKATFMQVEEQGEFVTYRDSGFSKNNQFIVKTMTKASEKSDLFLERSITFSNVQNIAKNIQGLVPEKSEAIYWLDSKKYTTRINYSQEKGQLVVKMRSPEAQWNGVKTFDLPLGNGNLCYYSSVIECAIKTGFLKKAISKGGGKMNFVLIWESYPYFQEQFLNVPSEPFAKASLEFDGVNRVGQYRFTLNAGGQSQFYFIGKDYLLKKHIWASQGFTRERK